MGNSDKVEERPTCQVLNFFYDDDDSSALTALINGIRFHIVVDVDLLRKSADENLLTDYLSLLQRVRSADTESVSDQSSEEVANASPALLRRSDRNSTISESGRDSAVDLSADLDTQSGGNTPGTKASTVTADVDLENWILSFFAAETSKLAPGESKDLERSLQEWYSGTTHFFGFDVKNDCIVPKRLEETPELSKRIMNLVPRMEMPKYIRDMDLPWKSASDILVVSEVSEPEPVHPGLVRVGDDIQFFKPVDPSEPLPTKREIKILQRIAKLGLDEKIRVPQLLGLVGYENSSTEIMGMLMTPISCPRPLTTLLSSDVPEDQRLRWAEESKEMVKILHDQGLVWGDAKADNFIVDENDDLWIIDFGGSYTEGWVDPEIAETKEGDKMGVEKIVMALVAPDENTFDPEDEDADDSDYAPPSKKRGRSAAESLRISGRKKQRTG